jgi:iodotyrosine deiodinase
MLTKTQKKDMRSQSNAYFQLMRTRRSIRNFTDEPVPRKVIENCIRTAATAPSGANQQPWYFVAVESQEMKRRIRVKAESVERDFYNNLAPDPWLKALNPIGTDQYKLFLETAPYLIVVFIQRYGVTPDGQKIKHYYSLESVSIAVGLLISAIHNVGLSCLTYTPVKMRFLNRLLDRPKSERPLMILAVGHPDPDFVPPSLTKKSFDQIAEFK